MSKSRTSKQLSEHQELAKTKAILAARKAAEPPPSLPSPFLALELPSPLPDGVSAEVAEQVLRDLKGDSPMNRMLARPQAVNLGLFTAEALDRLAGVPEAPAPKPPKAAKVATEKQDDAPRPPRLRSLQAEMYLLVGMIRQPETLAAVLEITRPDELGDMPHRRIFRVIVELSEHQKPVDLVLIRAMLEADDVALSTQALATLDAVLLLETPVPEIMPNYARLIHEKFVEYRDMLDREHLARMALDPKLRNGTFQAAVNDLLGKISEREAPDEDLPIGAWPEPAGPEVYHGIAGEVLRAIAPCTLADPMAILGQFLAAFANMCGRTPNWRYEDTRHGTQLFIVIAGPSAIGYKGTALNIALKVLEGCDPKWRHCTGLISGEGLIHSVRDPSHDVEKDQQLTLGKQFDKGVDDKRKLFVEREFATVMALKGRKGSTLDQHLRLAFDGEQLGNASRGAPTTATGYHIGVIGHCTFAELELSLTSLDKANGMANRFLWCCSRQSQPDTDEVTVAERPDWDKLGIRRRIRDALTFARQEEDAAEGLVLPRDEEAEALWREVKNDLANTGPGLLGAMKARARPIVMRIAGLYAVLDRSNWIREPHLRAALAYWWYCERSCSYIFGDASTDPIGDRIVAELNRAGADGMTLREFSRRFFRSNTPKASKCLAALVKDGVIRLVNIETKTGLKKVFVLVACIKKSADALTQLG